MAGDIKMHTNLLILHMKIELMRKTRVRLAEKHGRTHPLVLAQSRQLGKVIVEFEKLRKAG
jgi:hypothetical protein